MTTLDPRPAPTTTDLIAAAVDQAEQARRTVDRTLAALCVPSNDNRCPDCDWPLETSPAWEPCPECGW